MGNSFTMTTATSASGVNINDFGVTAAKLNNILNPAKQAYGYWVGAAVDAAGGTGGATGTFYDASQVYKTDQYNDFYFKPDAATRYFVVTACQGSTITCGTANLTTYTGAYEIQGRNYIDTAIATAIVTEVVAEIKSRLPEKYRRMLYEIDNEIIVEHAYYHQATAVTTWTTNDTQTLYLWRNPSGPWSSISRDHALYDTLDVTQSFASAADYTTSTANSATTISFGFGGDTTANGNLNDGDMIVARYKHALPTVPRSLESIALHLSAYEILHRHNATVGGDMPQSIVDHKDRALDLLDRIAKGEIGVTEFDNFKLYSETRGVVPPAGGIVCFSIDRG